MERIVFVHGSVGNGDAAWIQQRELADTYELTIVNRPGFPPGPLVDRIDFEEHGAWVAQQLLPGDHLVGHSYGAVVSLFAAGASPTLTSLTLIEPPAFGIASEDPDVADFVRRAKDLWASGETNPAKFLHGFYELVAGRGVPPFAEPMEPDLEQGARALMVERGPWEAVPPFAAIRAAGYPVLAVSGGWNRVFDCVLDVIAAELSAERATAAGEGHGAQDAPAFNAILRDFLTRASSSS